MHRFGKSSVLYTMSGTIQKILLKKCAVKHCHLKINRTKKIIWGFKISKLICKMLFYKHGFKSHFEIWMVSGIPRSTCTKDCFIDIIFFKQWLFNEIEGYFSHWHLKCIKQKKQQLVDLLSVFSSSLFLFTSSDCFSPSCSATFKNTYKYMINFSVKFFLQ